MHSAIQPWAKAPCTQILQVSRLRSHFELSVGVTSRSSATQFRTKLCRRELQMTFTSKRRARADGAATVDQRAPCSPAGTFALSRIYSWSGLFSKVGHSIISTADLCENAAPREKHLSWIDLDWGALLTCLWTMWGGSINRRWVGSQKIDLYIYECSAC